MRSGWETVHVGLTLSIRSAHSIRVFERLKARFPDELARFAAGSALVEYLNATGGNTGDLDEKDRILGALVLASSDPRTVRLAVELLILGLWPGLSNVFARLSRLYRRRPQDLTSDLLARFTDCVRRLDLRRCRRVAATLVRNTHRVVATARQTELRRAARTRCLPATLTDPEAEQAIAMVELRGWLAEVVPRDAELIFCVMLGGQNCHEAGDRLGISHASARQRLVRTLARIRPLLIRSAVTPGGFAPAFLGR